MKKPTLYITSGPPGSGKSTWVAKNWKGNVVSRDQIRFQFISDKDEYFSKENEVFQEFIRQIGSFLSKGEDVVADATHVTVLSRRRLLRNLLAQHFNIVYLLFKPPLDVCLERNQMRTGRQVVPSQAIIDMYQNFYDPKFEEDSRITFINLIGANGELVRSMKSFRRKKMEGSDVYGGNLVYQ